MSLEVLRKSRPRVAEVKISSGIVHVRSMSGGDRHQLVSGKIAQTDLNIAALGLCTPEGKPLGRFEAMTGELTQMDGDDVKAIARAVYKASNIKVKDDEDEALTEDPSKASQS